MFADQVELGSHGQTSMCQLECYWDDYRSHERRDGFCNTNFANASASSSAEAFN